MGPIDKFLPPQIRAMMVDEFTLRDNPIETRDRRRDSRRKDGVFLLLITVSTLWLFFVLTAWLLRWLTHEKYLRHGIPGWAGGSYGNLFLILFSGLHIWYVNQAAWRYTQPFFLQEYRQNTLSALLGTRTPPFQLVFQATTLPFKQALRIALAGLPFYALVWSFGGVRIGDIIGLYVLFATFGLRSPRWNAPRHDGMSAEQVAKLQRTARATSTTDYFLRNVAWLAPAMLTFNSSLNWAFGSGWAYRLVLPLWDLVPRDVADLFPLFFLSWPLIIVRWLCIPLPFYAFHLPPIVLAIPVMLLNRLIAAWNTSINLRASDQEAMMGLWDMRAYTQMLVLHASLINFFVLGYLWQPYVSSGITASLIYVKGKSPGQALAGLCFLMLTMGGISFWRVCSAIVAAVKAKLDVGAVERGQEVTLLRPYIRALLLPLWLAPFLYVLGCILSRENPFPPPVLQIGLPLIAVILANGILIAGLRLYTPYYLPLLLVPVVGWVVFGSNTGRWIAASSPFLSFASLSEHTQRILNIIPFVTLKAPTWQMCATTSLCLGVPIFAVLLRRQGRTSHQPAAKPPVVEVTAAAPPVQDLPVIESEIPDEPIVKKPKFREKRDTPVGLWIVEWVQSKWDSAVMIREMRVLFRGHLGKEELITYLALALLIILTAFHYSDVTSELLRPASVTFFGGRQGLVPDIIGGLIGVLAVIAAIVIPLVAAGMAARAFVRERDRSTLGFLLATPLSTKEILVGKFLGLMSSCAIALAFLGAWSLLFSLFMVPYVGPIPAALGFVASILPTVVLTLVGGLIGIVSSTLFRKETDSSSSAVSLVLGLDFMLMFMDNTVYSIFLPVLREYPTVTAIYVWLVCLLLSVAVIWPLGWALAKWRLDCARRGDIQMEGSSASARHRVRRKKVTASR